MTKLDILVLHINSVSYTIVQQVGNIALVSSSNKDIIAQIDRVG